MAAFPPQELLESLKVPAQVGNTFQKFRKFGEYLQQHGVTEESVQRMDGPPSLWTNLLDLHRPLDHGQNTDNSRLRERFSSLKN